MRKSIDSASCADSVVRFLILWGFLISSVHSAPRFTKTNFTCGLNFCKNVFCPAVTHCSEESIVRGGSLCGCCDSCITYLNEYERCFEDSKQQQHPKLLRSVCKKGMKCKNGICTKQSRVLNCEDVAKWRKYLRNHKTNLFTDELWIPECDKSGSYKKKQCKHKKCMCYDEDGTPLFGQEESDLAQNMTCGCSKEMSKLRNTSLKDRWMTQAQEHCDMKGDYKELQCVGDICYCSNTTTGEVNGRVTKMEFIDLLPCYDSSELRNSYKSQCELQLMRTRSLRYQFHKKNIDVIGLEYVECDTDGTFSPIQCMTDRCVCVDRKGTSMKSYAVEKSKTDLKVNMKCNCARDEHDISRIHARYRRMICHADGNYEPLQCFHKDHCFCVDEDGDIISKKLANTELQKNNCLNLRNTLKHPETRILLKEN